MDSLRQLGRGIHGSNRSAGYTLRRGGALPQIDRTRGFLRTTTAFIVPFVINNGDRKVSVSLYFIEGK